MFEERYNNEKDFLLRKYVKNIIIKHREYFIKNECIFASKSFALNLISVF